MSALSETVIVLLRDYAVAFAKGLLKENLADKLKEFLISKMPFLGGSFFNPILTFVVSLLAKFIYEFIKLQIDKQAIDSDLYLKDEAYKKARDVLSTALFITQVGDPNEIERLRVEMENRAAEATRIRTGIHR